MYMHFIHVIFNLIQSLMNINAFFLNNGLFAYFHLYIQSSTFIPILPLNGATSNKQELPKTKRKKSGLSAI